MVYLYDLSVDDLSVDHISVDDPSVHDLSAYDPSVDDPSVDDLSVDHLSEVCRVPSPSEALVDVGSKTSDGVVSCGCKL